MTQPIHVAMIILDYYPRVGGAQTQLAMLAPLLQAQNIRISVLTRRFPGLAAYEMVAGVPVYRLPASGPKPIAAFTFTLAALRWLYKQRPDLIHAYSFLSPLTTAVIAKRLLHIPVIAKVLRGGLLGDVYRLERKPLGSYRLAQYREHVSAFPIISAEIDAELQRIGVPEAKRHFIPNGVDTARFAPATPDQRVQLKQQLEIGEGKTAVYTGRLVPEKRVEHLIAAWPAVRQDHPDAQLLILGNGPREDILQQQAGAGVRFLGRLDNIVPYLQAADLFVLPSATEGLSNSLLEAMACGLPVVATDVGGAPDVVTSGQSGWLVPAEDPSALQNTILTALADSSLHQHMGHQARQVIVERYSLDTVANKLVNLYKSIERSA
jgi:glycosyltransferase involved in cell wall biosynthesis